MRWSTKLEICVTYEIKINESKTKLFAVNGDEGDTAPLYVDGLVVEQCDKYVHLGSSFTADGCTSSAVKARVQAKMPHVLMYHSLRETTTYHLL